VLTAAPRTAPYAPPADPAVSARDPLLVRVLRGDAVERPPVWMMRQAGRYLPEYREVRARRAGFVDMVRTPEVAAEITLQPVRRFGVDAAIVFSDILVVPEAMGLGLTVDDRTGPRLHDPVRDEAALGRLRPVDPERDLAYVLDALRATRAGLGRDTALIGFAGGPWTLAAYMLEGVTARGFPTAKRALRERPALVHALLDRLADAVGDFLVAQAAAGAQVLQLFESWGGALGPDDFSEFALPYLARAARRAAVAGVPVIVFAPERWSHAAELAGATGATALGACWHVRAADARRDADRLGVVVQGNLDPTALYGPEPLVRARTRAMLTAFAGADPAPTRGYIANLGHGILPDVPVANVAAFVETVQGWTVHERTAA
jgi:uroporphyrinogen decarboxylase